MKSIIITISFLFAGIIFNNNTLQAQKKKNIKTVSIKVEGICGMCKERIENALSVKGIKKAEWDQKSLLCEVTYRTDKMTEKEIHELLNDAGHDTEKSIASDAQYSNIHKCCRYREMESH